MSYSSIRYEIINICGSPGHLPPMSGVGKANYSQILSSCPERTEVQSRTYLLREYSYRCSDLMKVFALVRVKCSALETTHDVCTISPLSYAGA